MSTTTSEGYGAPDREDAARAKLKRAYVRVIAIEVVALAALWLLQTCYGG
jgi:hypothetical protein